MEKIWLNHYQPGVPKEIGSPAYPNLAELFDAKSRQFKKQTAFIHLGYHLSYEKLQQLSTQFAAYLQHLGLQPGDKVAIMLPNCMQYPISIFGTLKAGMTIVNTNPLYTAVEISNQLKDAQAKAIIILENFARTLEKALPNLPDLKHIIITRIGDVLPQPKKMLVNFVVKYWRKMIPEYQLPRSKPWQDIFKQKLPFQHVHIQSTDIAFIQYTGGTTGVAKGAMLSHANILANIMQCVTWISPLCRESEDRIVTALPLYHVFSLTANCLTFFYLGAQNLLISNPHELNFMIQQIKDFQFTAFTGVNTLFNILLHHPNFRKIDFSKLKLSLSGGMALQAAVAKKWHEITKTPILEAYGLTETSPGICINPMYVKEYNGSVGLPLPSTEISIRDNQGHEVKLGESGELCVRGPQVMQAYWQHPEETKQVFTEDGFLKTGDIAMLDEQGFVYLVDRKKDMILVSGFNVYPNEVEQVIGMMPGILEVGVIGVKIDDQSEKVKACIVKTDPNLSAEDIRQHCRQYLTPYKIPKIIEFYDTLPKSNVGKILRRSLH